MGKTQVLKKKKTGNFVILAIIMLIIGQMTVTTAMANNHGDTNFNFVFSYRGDWETTPERVKEDSTSVFMNCKLSEEAEDGFEAFVWGWDSDMNIDFESSRGYAFYEGYVYKMVNYVNENDGDYAYIKAQLINGGSDGQGIFSGTWSPDSI